MTDFDTKAYGLLHMTLALFTAWVLSRARTRRRAGMGQVASGWESIRNGAKQVRDGRRRAWLGCLWWAIAVPLLLAAVGLLVKFVTS